MKVRTEIYHARLNLPGGTVRQITLDEVGGVFHLTAFGGYDGFVSHTFDNFDKAWSLVLILQES